MAIMLGKLYDALRAAQGIPDTAAREAAEEVAGYESRLALIESRLLLLTWMVGTVTALVIAVLWLGFNLNAQLAALAARLP